MKNIHMSALGWQKIDLTSTVRQWYAEGAKSRLRLLIDCSGCEDRIDIHLLNNNKFNVKSKLDRKIIQSNYNKFYSLLSLHMELKISCNLFFVFIFICRNRRFT